MKERVYELLLKLERFCYYILNSFSNNSFENGNMKFADMLTGMQSLFELITYEEYGLKETGFHVDMESLLSILNRLFTMQGSKDYFGIQDVLAENLMPILEENLRILNTQTDFSYMPYLGSNLKFLEKNDNELFLKLTQKSMDYNKGIIEYASDGNATLKLCDSAGEYYLHGRKSAYTEETNSMKNYLEHGAQKYNVLGLGLGYHIIQLSVLSDFTAIDVYESDIRIIWQMIHYQSIWNLECFASNGISIHYDPYYTGFAAAMKRENEVSVFHYPSVRNIGNDKIKREFLNFYIRDNSYRQMYTRMEHNFYYNKIHTDYYIDELELSIKGKNVYIIAAGPSLDKNLEQLVHKPENSIIIATGTVLKKCYNRKIDVDYAVFLDAKDTIKAQVMGIEEWKIPIMIASSGCRYVTAVEKSSKYLICQSGFLPAESYAKEMGYRLYESGGSVSTLAFDVALQLQAKRIIVLGLDLAFTDNLAHAMDTSNQIVPEQTELFEQEGFWQKQMMKVDTKFDLYRKWFVRRIKEARQVGCLTEFVNATEGGVYIEGMKHMTLVDAMRL